MRYCMRILQNSWRILSGDGTGRREFEAFRGRVWREPKGKTKADPGIRTQNLSFTKAVLYR